MRWLAASAWPSSGRKSSQDRDAVPGPTDDLGHALWQGATLRLIQGVLLAPCFSCRIDGLHELDVKVGSNAVHERSDLVEEAVLVW